MKPDTVAAPDEVAAFLTRLTGLMLRSSGEGAVLIERTVRDTARALGADASVLLVPDGAALTVHTRGHTPRTVTLRGFPEVFRLDQVVAVKPLVQDVRAGRIGVAEADRRLAAIEASPPPYPWWLKLLGIVLFTLGFAPLMQATWYEVGATAVLGTVAAALAVAADRVPRFGTVLPLVVSTAVSVVTVEVFARDTAHGGPVLLMLPALFFFVPGDYLSAAAAELAAGYITTGAIRLVYAAFLLVQLYVGVLLGLYLTGTSTRALFDIAAASDLPRWALFLSWIVFTVGTLLAFAIPFRLLLPLLVLVYVTVGVQSLATKAIGETGGTFVAAAVLAAVATRLTLRPDQPPRLVLLLPGFFTLTVGSLGMRGLTTLAGGYVIEGFHDLLKLVTIVTAIAVGLVFGATLAQPAGARPARPSTSST
ncbi:MULTISPECIES: threonine/serine exporter family protein [unclassified Streptomyces]|uniref:threonine/serine exporter family protein n=1 Tax=unclassified Streptomyces TaxID=2593676 RepID=UPI002253FA67|nr:MULTISPECIES: threonine/serine exporter family protein [unclassified Streptomyces]MCX4989616.1 threonine/serine exporter family protein [Streptomyces sp. NBC_00568]MCX5005144.1 threonine/serine exporter family protein [Streptomyces sp. NBC_00638]